VTGAGNGECYLGESVDNLANRRAITKLQEQKSGEQTEGRCWGSTGTGGTLAGVSMYLKEKNPAIKTVLADPMGSALYSYVKTGKVKLRVARSQKALGIVA